MKCYLEIYKIEPVFETVFIWLKKIVGPLWNQIDCSQDLDWLGVWI